MRGLSEEAAPESSSPDPPHAVSASIPVTAMAALLPYRIIEPPDHFVAE
jgi:hypothetical protein